MQTDLGLIVLSVTTEQILTHSPVATPAEDALTIAIDVQHRVIDMVFLYPIVVTTYAKMERCAVGNLPFPQPVDLLTC